MTQPVLSGDDDIVGHAEEEPVLDDAAAGVQLRTEFLGIGDGTEGAVIDEVALVGDVGLAVFLGAQVRISAEFVEEVPLAGAAEGDDLDGQAVKGAELRRHLRFVDHDDFALAGLGHDFLVEQGAAAAFDQIEARVDLVGPVDGQIDDGGALGIDQREAGRPGGAGHFGRSGEAAESGQFAGGVAAGDFADGMDGGRAGAESDDGAGFEEADGVNGGGVFERVPVQRAHRGIVPFPEADGRNFGGGRGVLTLGEGARSIRHGAKAPNPPMEEVVRNQIREFLAGKGLRKTTQRDAIIEAAFSTDRHYTADELLDMARGIERTVSRATVYRTLPILVESGLLRELDLGQGRKVYDPNFVDHPHHNHLICLDCQTILEFEDLNMELLENCMAKRMGFTPANKQVRIEARCDELKLKGVCRKSGREVLAAI